jgi:hypothetical protein
LRKCQDDFSRARAFVRVHIEAPRKEVSQVRS